MTTNKEHKLLIQVKTERDNFFVRGKQRFQVVQDEVFELSLLVKNVGDSAFTGGIISGLELYSSGGQTIYHPIQKEFIIPSINPREEYVLKITKMLTVLCGPAWIKLDIKPIVETEVIQTFQLDQATKEHVVRPEKNSWGDGVLVYSQEENTTRNTNRLILLLTVITTWEALFGIKKTIFVILKCSSSLSFQLSNILFYLLHFFN